MNATGEPLPLALTMGEPAGVGGEITLKAWLRRQLAPAFFVIDEPERLARLAGELRLDVPVKTISDPAEAASAYPTALPVLAHPLAAQVAPGLPEAANAGAVLGAIERAVELVLAGHAAAVVTNPIHKRTLYKAGFGHPGHTEYLAELTTRSTGVKTTPVMMLASADLKVVPVTMHLPLSDAIAALSRERIVACARITAQALVTDFGVERPRLAIAGLNPHGGEGGSLGREEVEIIAPAAHELEELGLNVSGPHPADALFHERARETYDAAICMYHDQALIPLKTIDFEGGVNVTLGLPIVRTSPDHGTALEIAGTGAASETSLIAALKMGSQLARRRAAAGARKSVA
ncbi:MAG: 4-hydroxythreonine-4-phosphate dehydrogenase PdxA [Alphaproteobacteria bacterium]